MDGLQLIPLAVALQALISHESKVSICGLRTVFVHRFGDSISARALRRMASSCVN